MGIYVGGDECRVIYVARNGQQLRVSSVWVGDKQVFPPVDRQEVHVFTRGTQGYGHVDNGTHFGFTVPVPWWANSADVVIIGAGEKGRDGTKSFTGGSDGAGGRSGAWVVKTVALTEATEALVNISKGNSTSPHATEVVLLGGDGHPAVTVYDGEGTRTSGSGSTGGTPSPQSRTEYGQVHYSGAGGTRNNAGGHPGGGGGGGQGSNLLGNPTTGRNGGDGHVWLRFRSAPALNPGDEEFVLRVGVTSGVAYLPLRAWAVGIGKTYQTITEITVPMEVVGPSLYGLFYDCHALASAPALDTSQVTDMQYMFYGCQALTSVPDMDTSQVTSMRSMFYNCHALTSVPELDTSQATEMRYMFFECHALTTIPELNTSQATEMQAMFYGCSSLTSVPALDTSQVTDMKFMFYNCHALASVPELNTSQATEMRSMFYNCHALASVPELNTSQVTEMRYMFFECHALATVPDMDTGQVMSMHAMFQGCSSLTSVPALDTSQVTDMQYMFYNCSSLESVTLPGMGNGFTAKQTLDMTSTKLNATAANALMQSLGTPPPGGTLQLPSTATGANRSIATAKNWTVTIG